VRVVADRLADLQAVNAALAVGRDHVVELVAPHKLTNFLGVFPTIFESRSEDVLDRQIQDDDLPRGLDIHLAVDRRQRLVGLGLHGGIASDRECLDRKLAAHLLPRRDDDVPLGVSNAAIFLPKNVLWTYLASHVIPAVMSARGQVRSVLFFLASSALSASTSAPDPDSDASLGSGSASVLASTMAMSGMAMLRVSRQDQRRAVGQRGMQARRRFPPPVEALRRRPLPPAAAPQNLPRRPP
jgi:hypothetical protein